MPIREATNTTEGLLARTANLRRQWRSSCNPARYALIPFIATLGLATACSSGSGLRGGGGSSASPTAICEVHLSGETNANPGEEDLVGDWQRMRDVAPNEDVASALSVMIEDTHRLAELNPDSPESYEVSGHYAEAAHVLTRYLVDHCPSVGSDGSEGQ